MRHKAQNTSVGTCGRVLCLPPYLVREREGVVAVEVHPMRRFAEAQVAPLPGLAPVHVLNWQHLGGGAGRRLVQGSRHWTRIPSSYHAWCHTHVKTLHALRVLFRALRLLRTGHFAPSLRTTRARQRPMSGHWGFKGHCCQGC